jgi:DsbC/DsbD-like thiol-disulfide interchange protein
MTVLIAAAVLAVLPMDGPLHAAPARERIVRAAHADVVLHPLTTADAVTKDAAQGKDAARGPATMVRITVRPKPGIHIYAPGQRGYYPLSLVFDEGEVVTTTPRFPDAEPYVFTPTGERFLVYRQPFVVTQSVVRRSTAAKPLRATLRFQACDDRVCYRPEEARLTW